jgi:hypothetical protein
MGALDKYEAVIGLEVHVQLATRSKIFSGASAAFGAAPNAATDPVVLGMPGVLPVLNAAVMDMAVRFGLAVGGHIRPALPVRAQALLLSRPAQGLSDLPVRRAAGRGRGDLFPPARRAATRCGSPAFIWRRTPARTCTTDAGASWSTTTARACRCARW